MTTEDLYATARELEPTFMTEGVATTDVLDALRIIVGHGFHDGQAGDLETIGIVATCVGPFLLYTYEDGHETWREAMGEAAAYAELRRLDDRVAQVEAQS